MGAVSAGDIYARFSVIFGMTTWARCSAHTSIGVYARFIASRHVVYDAAIIITAYRDAFFSHDMKARKMGDYRLYARQMIVALSKITRPICFGRAASGIELCSQYMPLYDITSTER